VNPVGSEEREIKSLTLYFPHGVTAGECAEIARRAGNLVRARVSEGGYETEGCFGLHMDPIKFRKDAMTFTFGYEEALKEDGGGL
jgi:hypothetical protein